jgi:hypothetical protein
MPDPFDEAVAIHDRMGALMARPDEFKRELVSVMGLLQVAIHRRPQHDRAHIMLADAYYTAAQLSEIPLIQEYFLVSAAAVTVEWRLAPRIRPVKASDAFRAFVGKLPGNRSKQFEQTIDQLMGQIALAIVERFAPELFQYEFDQASPIVDEILENLHRQYIESALDPAEIPAAYEFLTKRVG